MEFAKQYEVWDVVDGNPVRLRVEMAIGMRLVRIDGQWHERSAYFDHEEDVVQFLAKPVPEPIPIYIQGLDF